MFAGCAGSDPWNTMDRTPNAPSMQCRADADPVRDARAFTSEVLIPPEALSGELTLAECIRAALENNPRTRGAWSAARAAAARVGEQKAAFLPQANILGGVRRSDVPTSRNNQPETIYNAGVELSYLLYDGGARAAQVSKAEAELIAANYLHTAAIHELAMRVREAYYDLLAAHSLLEVAQETDRQTHKHVELAQARHETGLVARSDVLKAQTRQADAALGLVRAQSNQKVARGKLASAMNLELTAPFEVAPASEEAAVEIARLGDLLDTAALMRPELQAALAQVGARRSELQAANAGYRPDISITTAYGVREDSFAPQDEEWSVGAVLSLPLFTGFERSYRVRGAQANLKSSVFEYEKALQEVSLEVWTTYQRTVEARQAIDAATALVESARESLDVAEGEYKNGIGSIIDLIDAQTAYTHARNQLVQARLDRHTALARLERAVGQSLAWQSGRAMEEGEQP